MRTMQKGDLILNVIELIILKNFWEYYIVEDEENTEDYKFALVMGDATELGVISMEEISPYIIARTTDLSEVMPAPGYTWEE